MAPDPSQASMKPGSTGLMTSIIDILPNQMRPSKRAILPLRPYHPNHPHYRARGVFDIPGGAPRDLARAPPREDMDDEWGIRPSRLAAIPLSHLPPGRRSVGSPRAVYPPPSLRNDGRPPRREAQPFCCLVPTPSIIESASVACEM